MEYAHGDVVLADGRVWVSLGSYVADNIYEGLPMLEKRGLAPRTDFSQLKRPISKRFAPDRSSSIWRFARMAPR